MILSFRLSMPNVASWNGRWSGDGRPYVIVKTFRSKRGQANADRILSAGYYHYNFGDGWSAGVTVEHVGSVEARRLRANTAGFSGYNWMVDEIIEHGKILGPFLRPTKEQP